MVLNLNSVTSKIKNKVKHKNGPKMAKLTGELVEKLQISVKLSLITTNL